MSEKVVLAYSGGLDTSVAIKWIEEKYGYEVIALAIDIGMEKDYPSIQQRALDVGALKSLVIDAREVFIRDFVFPALQANALYEGEYPLATALARPLIAKLLVDVAHEERATAVAHGCTGKGNDQVRFDVSIAALDPKLKIIAPAREWGMTREEEIAYAKTHGITIPVTSESPYSTDENLWGRSIECGILEDPWIEPPEEIYDFTKSPKDAPDEPAYVEIEFDEGEPITLDGKDIYSVELIDRLAEIAGEHGVGRIDNLENRLVGIKSREIYEAPAATVLLKAHRALEAMTLSRDQQQFKEIITQKYSNLIYDGLWFGALRNDLAAYVKSSQQFVSGIVRVKLFKGNCTVVGRKSPHSLYDVSLATYDKGDVFDQSASVGFIHIWSLPVKTQAQIQPQEQRG
ncbi:MAG: argininosuccinate synthase [Chloroflexota bacterium]|nr:argininosuccinate synthase [Chloroflexota bacterium]